MLAGNHPQQNSLLWKQSRSAILRPPLPPFRSLHHAPGSVPLPSTEHPTSHTMPNLARVVDIAIWSGRTAAGHRLWRRRRLSVASGISGALLGNHRGLMPSCKHATHGSIRHAVLWVTSASMAHVCHPRVWSVCRYPGVRPARKTSDPGSWNDHI